MENKDSLALKNTNNTSLNLKTNTKLDSGLVQIKSDKNVISTKKTEVLKKASTKTRKILKKKKTLVQEKNIKVLFSTNEDNIVINDNISIKKELSFINSIKPSNYYKNFDFKNSKFHSFSIIMISILIFAITKYILNLNFSSIISNLLKIKLNLNQNKIKLPIQMRIVCKLCYYINLSLFFSIIAQKYEITHYNTFQIFSLLILILFLYDTFVKGINFVIFNFSKTNLNFLEVNKYLNNYKSFEALLLFPILFLQPFLSDYFQTLIIVIGLVFVVLIELIRILNSSKSIIENKFSVLHSIIYIGAIEVAPLLIIYKSINQ
jgi:hypothetical protein